MYARLRVRHCPNLNVPVRMSHHSVMLELGLHVEVRFRRRGVLYFAEIGQRPEAPTLALRHLHLCAGMRSPKKINIAYLPVGPRARRTCGTALWPPTEFRLQNSCCLKKIRRQRDSWRTYSKSQSSTYPNTTENFFLMVVAGCHVVIFTMASMLTVGNPGWELLTTSFNIAVASSVDTLAPLSLSPSKNHESCYVKRTHRVFHLYNYETTDCR